MSKYETLQDEIKHYSWQARKAILFKVLEIIHFMTVPPAIFALSLLVIEAASSTSGFLSLWGFTVGVVVAIAAVYATCSVVYFFRTLQDVVYKIDFLLSKKRMLQKHIERRLGA